MDEKDKDLINMLWDEWKYRNTLYWQMIYRFGFMILFVSFIPYVYPKVISHLGKLVIAFPICGMVLSIFSAWILDAEAARFSHVKYTLNKHRGDYLPERFPENGGFIWWLRRANIGYGISILFSVVFVLLSILSAASLWFYGLPNIK
ncbi:hypothetical protein GCM10011352_35610 [Marinobacterium zhoushanense]|uniref:Uncharacterized protein n=1 Tax=Marinobacterium zhoushanense TaxID=1679163 RepID=A0ABQ1KSV3_9GAMM|nr:hypothetical protein [Marinobacterium zhoushanense]GGC06246.1 hypothetical protein GCM10011352_35610 [Marinobacterium zhoushanense]